MRTWDWRLACWRESAKEVECAPRFCSCARARDTSPRGATHNADAEAEARLPSAQAARDAPRRLPSMAELVGSSRLASEPRRTLSCREFLSFSSAVSRAEI
eukprot:TRINITY_DN18787_c0_g1_i1.p5 TRINITY_DN18787_c0_g1~~TRINITY_DN18787_c0_g1_i1.p5  ORF type:complete len:101 (+),score=15.79 TRINITY_DN18787_c0_g1_i1:274-576(+)